MPRGFLILLTLLLAGPASLAQGAKPLQANPAEDLFTLATLAYEEALATKDKNLRQGYYETALRQFEKFRGKFPANARVAESWYYSAVCHDKIGQADKALSSLRMVMAVAKTGKLAGAAASQVGARCYRAEKYPEAVDAFLVASQEHEDEAIRHTARYQRALCFEKLGKNTELAAALKLVIGDEGSPYRVQARQALAHLLRKQGKPEPALEQFRVLMESEDAKVRSGAILNAALLARELKLADETSALFLRILDTGELKKWHGESQLYLMELAARAKDHGKVIALFERGRFPLKPAQASKRLLLAIRARESGGTPGDTTALYRELVKITPEKKTAYEASYILLSRGFPGEKPGEFAKEARQFLKDHAKQDYLDSRFQSVRLMLAETDYRAGNFGPAADTYGTIALDSLDAANHAGIRFHLATALRKAGREKEADEALAEFLKHHPDDPRVPPALARRADRALAEKDRARALADFELTLELTKDPALIEYVWIRKATIYKDRNDLPELKASHEFLLATYPDRPATATASSFFWLGWAQFRLEEIPGAVSSFGRARTIDAKSFGREATVHIALAHYGQEQLQELQQEAERLDRDHPGTKLPHAVYAWLGTRLAKEGNFAGAWQFLPRAVAGRDPAEVVTGVWLAYARSAFATDHFDEATASYTTLLKRETNAFRQAEYHYHLARCWQARENNGKATAQAEEALALKPQGELNGRIRLLLGKLAAAEGDPETAIQHYVVVAELFSDDPETRSQALTSAIAILEKRGNPEDLAQAEEYRKQLNSP